MNIGKLDEKINIYYEAITTNALNENQPSKALLKSIYANVEARTGSLLSGRPAETFLSKTTHAIQVRAEEVRDVHYNNWIEWTDANGLNHKLDIDYILPAVRNSRLTTIYAHETI